jgi:hypothetical protein
MTIIEALKSGKPFKRAQWSGYYHSDGYKIVSCDEGIGLLATEGDILADNWEVKEKEDVYEFVKSGITYNGAPLYKKILI